MLTCCTLMPRVYWAFFGAVCEAFVDRPEPTPRRVICPETDGQTKCKNDQFNYYMKTDELGMTMVVRGKEKSSLEGTEEKKEIGVTVEEQNLFHLTKSWIRHCCALHIEKRCALSTTQSRRGWWISTKIFGCSPKTKSLMLGHRGMKPSN